jgi:hypothetical protein
LWWRTLQGGAVVVYIATEVVALVVEDITEEVAVVV